MSRKMVLIEVDAEDKALIRDYSAFLAEMRDLAGSAPAGRVLAACEEAVVACGREIQKRVLQRVVQERVDTAEKGGAAEAVRLWSAPRESRTGHP